MDLYKLLSAPSHCLVTLTVSCGATAQIVFGIQCHNRGRCGIGGTVVIRITWIRTEALFVNFYAESSTS